MARQKKHSASHSAQQGKKPKINLFGKHAVTEAWLNQKRHIHALYITENALQRKPECRHC